MSLLPRVLRRAGSVLVCVGLLIALAACDSGGSGRSSRDTTTTSRRKPHRSTTTSSTRAATTSSTSSTTAPSETSTPSSPPPATPAAPLPCATQAAALTALVQGGDLPIPADSYTVGDCRIAPSSLIWAAVVLTPKPGQTVPQLTVVAERIGSLWTVHSYGPGTTGCDAPAPVPAELRLGC